MRWLRLLAAGLVALGGLAYYDHAMDAPEVARRTGALLLGSESTANIGRGWGLEESQIRVTADRAPISLGRFTLTPIESRHFQFPDPDVRERALGDPEIREPLVPPAGAFDHKVGKAYVLHVAHPSGSFLIVGSAGFVPGVHFDSLVGPIEGPFTGEVRAGAILGEGSDRTLEFLRQKEAAHPEIEFVTLPRYAPVVLLREPEPKGT